MRRCFRLVVFGLLLFITFTPNFADALPYNAVVYGPLTSTNDGVQTVEVGVVAFGKYDAAMVALGYDGAFINGLSDDDRAKLSNQETGGDFWSFAQKFTLAPNDDIMTLNGITWKSLNSLYGYGNVRRGVYTQGEAANAKRDMLKILTDGGLGGGGSAPSDGYYTFKSNIYFEPSIGGSSVSSYYIQDTSGVKYTNVYNYSGLDYTTYKLLPESVTLRMPKQTLASLNSRFPYDSNTWYVYIQLNAGKIDLYFVAGNVIEPNIKTQSLSGDGKPTIVNEYIKKLNYTYESIYTSHLSFSSNYTFENGVITYTGANDLVSSRWPNGNGFWSAYVGTFYLKKADVTPSVPPTNWPSETPAPAPTVPEVPEPSEPDLPTQPSTPTAPSLPDYPSYVIAPGTTYDTFDIQAILDAMDEHCQHIQSAVYQGFSDYFDTFTPWLRDEFSTLRTFLREEDDWVVESISDEFMELRSYLKELAEWLADQMDFTITGGDYDDSTVVSWLKKIYFKLGGSSVNTKPVDPVGDPDGSWDWLNQLIEGILSALAGGAANLAGSLGDLFQGIKDKFPFSIPWDIVAIVALLDAPPVTPAAVIEYDVFGAHVRYDIDLHFFDEQASVIRAMEDVIFCAFLLFKTNWLNGIFDGIGDFLGGKLKSTVKSP